MKATVFLSKKKEDVLAIQNSINTHFTELSTAIIHWQPNPQKWSIAQCFEHLNIYCEYYFNTMQTCMRKTKAIVKDPNYDYEPSWLGRKSIASVDPNNDKKQKTLKRFNPPLPQVRANTIQLFEEYQKQFLVVLEEANKVNINKIKIPIEFFKLLKLRMGDCIEFMIMHQQRHLEQAKRVLALGQTHLNF